MARAGEAGEGTDAAGRDGTGGLEASPGATGRDAPRSFDAYAWASQSGSLVAFIAFSSLLEVAIPGEAGPVWALLLLAVAIGSEAMGFRYTRGLPLDAMPGRREVLYDYRSAVFLGSIVYTSFALMPLAALFLEDAGDAFMAGLIASVPVGGLLGLIRLRLSRVESYHPESEADPGAPVRPTHWVGLALLLLSAAASWRLIAGTIGHATGSLDSATAGLANASVGERIGVLVAVALGVIAVALPAGFLCQWAIPQLYMVQERVTAGYDSSTRKYVRMGLTLGVNLLVDLAIALFL